MKKLLNIKRSLFLLLALCMVAALSPLAVLATENADAPVAKVNADYYTDLDSAVAAFNSSGGTFTLLSNCTKELETNESWITLTAGGTFDLNGHTLKATGSGTAAVRIETTGATLTIMDSSENGTGRITGASYSIYHNGNWDVYINSGTYQNFGRFANGSLIINGGTFENYAFGNTADDNAKVVLNGGTFRYGIWFPGFDNQNVYEILGEGKTYAVGEEIWKRSSVQALGDVYEFEKGNCVTVLNESDAVASLTWYNSLSDQTPSEIFFTSLSAAISRENAGYYFNSFVTLLKDTNEDITIDQDIKMIFRGNAGGVFTFAGEGNSIYLLENLPDGMTLKAKCDSYPTELSRNDPVIWASGDGVSVAADDVEPVAEGVKAQKWGQSAGVGLVHIHEWTYVVTGQDGQQKISAVCKYPQSCTLSENYAVASVAIYGDTVTYDAAAHMCSIGKFTQVDIFSGEVPDLEDIIYYDAEGNALPGAPVNAGTYTAKITFGDKTIEAELVIEPANLEESFFTVVLPENAVYDGATAYAAQVVLADGAVGVGDVSIRYNGSETAPTDAGTYTVTLEIAAGMNYQAATLENSSWTFTVAKANQSAPAVGKVDETVSGKNDGKITGVNSTMEYRKDGESTYQAIVGDVIESLADGKYFVRFKGDSNHDPSPETAVTIAQGRMLTVTYQIDRETVGTAEVEYGGNVTLPDIPEKEGCTQTAPAWDHNGMNITDDIRITAVYTINKYTVTYMVDGQVLKTETVEHSKDASLPAVPAKKDYTGKWDGDGKHITSDTVIKAVYVQDPVKVPDRPQSPPTGDESQLCLGITLMFLSGCALIALTGIGSKRKTAR